MKFPMRFVPPALLAHHPQTPSLFRRQKSHSVNGPTPYSSALSDVANGNIYRYGTFPSKTYPEIYATAQFDLIHYGLIE